MSTRTKKCQGCDARVDPDVSDLCPSCHAARAEHLARFQPEDPFDGINA